MMTFLLLVAVFTGVLVVTPEIITNKGLECKDIKFPFICGEGQCDIARRRYCDGVSHCSNGADETPFNSSLHEGKGLNCTRSSEHACFLPKQYICDHELDCDGGIDECGCESSFQCNNGDCAIKITFCDEKSDCADGTDEVQYSRTTGGFQCQVSKRHVTLSCVLPDVHVCDGSSECNWGTDECFCTNGKPTADYVNDKCFRCLDGTLVIPSNQVCDGVFHCKDLSDECLCSEFEQWRKNTTSICDRVCMGDECACPGQLQCTPSLAKTTGSIMCVDPESICDDVFDCDEGFDEDFCPFINETFSCKDRSGKVRNNVVCDGIDDCSDGSDEHECHKEKYVCDVYHRDIRRNWTHHIGWPDDGTHPPLNRSTLENDLRRIIGTGWQYRFPYYADKCDGVPLCAYGRDECGPECDEKPGFCNFVVNQSLRCPNSRSLISGHEVCDGQPTCNETAPHESEDEKGCPNRFYCTNNGSTRLPIHIPENHRCDGLAECDDQSDELNCPESTHFYCTNGGSTLFISVDQVCDKRIDCKGGEDECANCPQGPFSSDDRLIKSRILVGFLWIMGLMATIGNTVIVIHQIFNLYKMRNQKQSRTVALKNRILVMNLAVADLLVGIYLLALGAKDANVEQYCLLDQEWRSSGSCAALGAIVVLGTEASILIIVVMTTYRLLLVYRPYQRNQRVSSLLLPTTVAWIVAIVLAVIPLAPSLSDYFLSCVWFQSHRYLGYACKADVVEFTEKLVAFEGKNSTFSKVLGSDFSWSNILEAQKLLNSSYVPGRYFGYYAAQSVCLPRFFPDRKNDESWGYSLLLLLINCFAFLYIFLGYIFIYRKSTSNEHSARNDERTAILQRKVTRIVLTNFCCWVPICVMGFMKLGGRDVNDIAYAVTAIILLPINSAMNPFLYSSLLDMIWKQVQPVTKRISEVTVGKSIGEKVKYVKDSNGDSAVTSVTHLPESSPKGQEPPRTVTPAPVNAQ